jgi:peptide deformylase
MALLPIIIAPDRRLKETSVAVERVDDAIRALIDDMIETMYAAPGIGLAAVQVGVAKRIVVVDPTREGEDSRLTRLVNPAIVRVSDELVVYEEGCLSFPDHFAEVARPAEVEVRYLDYDGELRTLEAEGVLATCVQHEIDHLDGKLFVDRLSVVKRSIIMRKMAKAKRQKRQTSD